MDRDSGSSGPKGGCTRSRSGCGEAHYKLYQCSVGLARMVPVAIRLAPVGRDTGRIQVVEPLATVRYRCVIACGLCSIVLLPKMLDR
jgi:hypothetical protein